MNRVAKFLFTATAFAPAMFVYGAVWAIDGCVVEAAISVLVGAVLVALCWALTDVAVRKLGEMEFLPTKVETADNEVMSFVLLYVLPLVTRDLATYNWGVWTLIAVFLCWIVARSYAYQFNPMLAVLGWHFYKVSDDSGVSYALMTKREFHKAETPIVVGMLATYTLIENRNKEAPNMVARLFAVCGDPDGHQTIKDVVLSKDIQDSVRETFIEQETAFRKGSEELDFEQNWKPDHNEIMKTPVFEGASLLANLLGKGSVGIPAGGRVTANDMAEHEIKGLVVPVSESGGGRVLVQLFENAQVLAKGARLMTLLLRDGTFERFDDSALRLAGKLTCIVEDELVKFKSLHQLSRIIDTSEIFGEASDAELATLVTDGLFEVANMDVFQKATNRRARGYIHRIMTDGALVGRTAQGLQSAAKETNLTIEVVANKIVIPTDGKGIVELFQFLNSGRYNSPITNSTRVTNSHRAADA